MKPDMNAGPDLKWRWPRFNLRTLFATTGVYAILAGGLLIIRENEDAIGPAFGSLILVWGVFCWHVVRLNRNWIAQKLTFLRY
jgi:hypothetical protein